MAFVHGKETNVLIDGSDVTSYLNQAATSRGHATALTTTFGNDDHTYIAGLESGNIAMGGYFDGDTDAIHDVLGGLFAGDNSPVISVAHQGFGTIGNVAIMLAGIQTQYDIAGSVADAVAITASADANGGLRNGGTVIHALGERTTTFDGSSNDEGGSTAFGGAAHLHVTAFTGTDVDIRLQDSANDSTWADLAAWAGTSAVGGYRTVVTGTVDQYLRVIIDGGTFSSVTFAVCFARNRR